MFDENALPRIREALKMLIKEQIRKGVSQRGQLVWQELQENIANAGDYVASTVLDETKIEEIAQAARAGAAYAEIDRLIEALKDEALMDAQVMVTELYESLRVMLEGVISEAIVEAINEEVQRLFRRGQE